MALSSLPGGNFEDVNDAYVELLGYLRNELIGKNTVELGLFAHAEHQKKIAEQLNDKGAVTNVEIQVHCKDGTILDGLFWGEPVVIRVYPKDSIGYPDPVT